jgi:hypothetical protein
LEIVGDCIGGSIATCSIDFERDSMRESLSKSMLHVAIEPPIITILKFLLRFDGVLFYKSLLLDGTIEDGIDIQLESPIDLKDPPH